MNKQNLLWGIAGLVVGALLMSLLGGSKPVFGSSGAGITNLSGLSIDGTSPGTLTVNGATTLTGAVTVSSTVTINGVTQTTSRNAALTQATTTPCAIQGPAATSTVEWAVMNTTIGTTTASTITMATSTNAFATTSPSFSTAIAANAQSTIAYQGIAGAVLAPNAWVVFGIAGGTGTFSNTGTCSAEFYNVN